MMTAVGSKMFFNGLFEPELSNWLYYVVYHEIFLFRLDCCRRDCFQPTRFTKSIHFSSPLQLYAIVGLFYRPTL